MQFIQNLNNWLTDKSELSSLRIIGDWNCTLTKKDKKGGLRWKPTIFRNSILNTMDMLHLIDIQRIKHLNVDKYSHESKALKMKSKTDYFLMAKNLTKFFDLIGEDLVKSVNVGYEKGKLLISHVQRRGIISLIPKEDSEFSQLQNWRPIALLSVDYKIALKAIAKRIEPLLPHLIHPDQTGFVKDRYLGEKSGIICDVMEQTNKVSAIPNHLLQKARELIAFSDGSIMNNDLTCFPLDENNNINLLKTKSKDFYWLVVNKSRTNPQTGPELWSKSINPENKCWKEIFQSVHRTCVENKLREFHFKFIHRIIVAKKELFRFKIKEDSSCIYCEEEDQESFPTVQRNRRNLHDNTCIDQFAEYTNCFCLPNPRVEQLAKWSRIRLLSPSLIAKLAVYRIARKEPKSPSYT